MELWDVYNADRIKVGKTVERGRDNLAPGEYHLTVHAAIFDTGGRMLIQQRTDSKESWPSLWDITVGGAVTAGEDTRLGIERELAEELGIKMSFEGLRPHLTIHSRSCICDVYIFTADIDLSTLALQDTEVQAVRYATREEILELISEGKFIPYQSSFISLLFDQRLGRGSHIKK